MFSRLADGDYEIYTIKPDGTGVKRLTHSRGNDAHMAWSPDGEHIVFASSRMGFKDEVTYTDAPQPYGEIFVMRFDGSRRAAAHGQPVGGRDARPGIRCGLRAPVPLSGRRRSTPLADTGTDLHERISLHRPSMCWPSLATCGVPHRPRALRAGAPATRKP